MFVSVGGLRVAINWARDTNDTSPTFHLPLMGAASETSS
jgi:hypothetical protein